MKNLIEQIQKKHEELTQMTFPKSKMKKLTFQELDQLIELHKDLQDAQNMVDMNYFSYVTERDSILHYINSIVFKKEKYS